MRARAVDAADTAGGAHQNIARASLVLSALAGAGDSGMRLTDIVQSTRLSKTAAHRCLAGLTLHGLASYEPDLARFFLGDRIFVWAATARSRYELAERAAPFLRRLADETEDTVYFMVRRGDEAICLGRAEGSFPIKTLTLSVGDRRPLGTNTGGIAIMAFLDASEIDRVLRDGKAARQAYPISDSELRNRLADAQARGHSSIDGQIMRGMSGVGVPVRNPAGTPVAALSVAAISSRLERARRDRIVAIVKAEAKRMEAELASLLGQASGTSPKKRAPQR